MSATPDPRPRRDLLAFDRADRWALAALLGVVVALSAAAGVVVPVLRWVRGEGIPLPFLSEVTVPALDAVGTRYGAAEYAVTLAGPSTGQRLLDLVPGVLVVLLLAAGSWLVVAVMRTIAAGDPFAAANVGRLRAIAGLLAIGPFVTAFVELPFRGALLGDVDLGGLDPGMAIEMPWAPLVAGLVLALLAEAFKTGRRLRDDVEGLV
jgi:hypothetical protein